MQIQINEARRKTFWADYTATVLGMIGKALAGDSWKLNSYVEMAYPDLLPQDKRNADDIKADILAKLKYGFVVNNSDGMEVKQGNDNI